MFIKYVYYYVGKKSIEKFHTKNFLISKRKILYEGEVSTYRYKKIMSGKHFAVVRYGGSEQNIVADRIGMLSHKEANSSKKS